MFGSICLEIAQTTVEDQQPCILTHRQANSIVSLVRKAIYLYTYMNTFITTFLNKLKIAIERMEVNGGHGVDSHGRERKERRNSGHTEYSLIQQ